MKPSTVCWCAVHSVWYQEIYKEINPSSVYIICLAFCEWLIQRGSSCLALKAIYMHSGV